MVNTSSVATPLSLTWDTAWWNADMCIFFSIWIAEITATVFDHQRHQQFILNRTGENSWNSKFHVSKLTVAKSSLDVLLRHEPVLVDESLDRSFLRSLRTEFKICSFKGNCREAVILSGGILLLMMSCTPQLELL